MGKLSVGSVMGSLGISEETQQTIGSAIPIVGKFVDVIQAGLKADEERFQKMLKEGHEADVRAYMHGCEKILNQPNPQSGIAGLLSGGINLHAQFKILKQQAQVRYAKCVAALPAAIARSNGSSTLSVVHTGHKIPSASAAKGPGSIQGSLAKDGLDIGNNDWFPDWTWDDKFRGWWNGLKTWQQVGLSILGLIAVGCIVSRSFCRSVKRRLGMGSPRTSSRRSGRRVSRRSSPRRSRR